MAAGSWHVSRGLSLPSPEWVVEHELRRGRLIGWPTGQTSSAFPTRRSSNEIESGRSVGCPGCSRRSRARAKYVGPARVRVLCTTKCFLGELMGRLTRSTYAVGERHLRLQRSTCCIVVCPNIEPVHSSFALLGATTPWIDFTRDKIVILWRECSMQLF